MPQNHDYPATYHLLKSDSEEHSTKLGETKTEQIEDESAQEDNEPIRKSSTWQALANLTAAIEGTGLLALPYVIAQSGLVAIAALMIIPSIAYYTGTILIDCLYEIDVTGERVRTRTNYKDLGAACSPRFGAVIVATVQYIELFLIASLNLVLAASLASSIFPESPLSEKSWMIIAAAAGLPIIFVKNLSQVAWLSLLSVIALFVVVVVVLSYGFAHYSTWVPRKILFWSIDGVPASLAIIILSYICHPVLPTIEASMEKRSQFRTVLALVYLFAAMLKIVFSVCAYFSFSSNIQDVIVNSLPMGITHLVVNSFLILNVLFSYPFLVIAIIQIIEESVSAESFPFKIPDLVWFAGIRLVTNFLTLLPAISIPHYGLFMAFIGSLASSSQCFIFPPLFHLILKTKELKAYHYILDISIIVFGVLVSILGLLHSGKELFENIG